MRLLFTFSSIGVVAATAFAVDAYLSRSKPGLGPGDNFSMPPQLSPDLIGLGLSMIGVIVGMKLVWMGEEARADKVGALLAGSDVMIGLLRFIGNKLTWLDLVGLVLDPQCHGFPSTRIKRIENHRDEIESKRSEVLKMAGKSILPNS